MDKLEEIFQLQGDLNDRILMDKFGYSMLDIYNDEDVTANGMTNEWLKKYVWALKDEVRELEDELLNKWWSSKELDMQNIKVEIIDILHFWVSIAIASGMSAGDAHHLYMQKNSINHKRQDVNYHEDKDKEMGNHGVS